VACITIDHKIVYRDDCPVNALKDNQIAIKIRSDSSNMFYAIIEILSDRVHAYYVWGQYARDILVLELFCAGLAQYVGVNLLSFSPAYNNITNLTAKRLGYIKDGDEYVKHVKAAGKVSYGR